MVGSTVDRFLAPGGGLGRTAGVATSFTALRLRFLRTWKFLTLTSVASTALAVVAWRLDVLEMSGAEASAYDAGLQLYTDKPFLPWWEPTLSREVVVVAIDDRTFSEVQARDDYKLQYGAWPYSRNLWAHVAVYLSQAGARMAVMDAVIDEAHPDPAGDVAFSEALVQTRFPFLIGFKDLPGQAELPAVEAKNRGPAELRSWSPGAPEGALGSQKELPKDSDETFPSDEAFPSEDEPAAARLAALDGGVAPQVSVEALERAARALAFPVEAKGGLSVPGFPAEPKRDAKGAVTGWLARNPVAPIAPLLEAASGFGWVGMEVDGDGKLRRTRFAYSDGRNQYVTLPVAAAADYFGAEQVVLEPGRLVLADHVVPINDDGSAEIDYGGEIARRFEIISLFDVLQDYWAPPGKRTLTERFRGKVVVIGAFALGTGDVKATPFNPQAPGVSKQAATLDNLLTGRFITEAPFWVSVLLGFVLAFLSAAIITTVKWTPLEILWPILLFVGFFAVPGVVLVGLKVHVLTVMPSLAGQLASLAAAAFNHFFAERERDNLRAIFERYMEKELVTQLVEGKQLPSLEGEVRDITAYFCDIRGFSTFSEAYRDDPKGLMRILNRYLSCVTGVLVKHGGCIDKYIGDAVVCLFGAPLNDPAHALSACRASLAVQAALAQLRQELSNEGLPDVYTRIGLNTDRMLVGSIGSEELYDYTAIGDGMNLASRLEGTNKPYGTLILIGPKTYEEAREGIEARELDWVRVAGKLEAVPVYELMALKGGLSPQQQRLVELYATALARYRSARFEEALAVLDEALRVVPGDGPSLFLAKRCKALLASPPTGPFDAVAALEK